MNRPHLEFNVPPMSRMSYDYKSLDNFRSYLSMRKVLSVLWFHKYQGYYIVTKMSVVGIKLSFTSSDEIGRWFRVEVINNDQQEFLTYDNDNDDAVILLPGTNTTALYTPIFYSWKVKEYSSKKT